MMKKQLVCLLTFVLVMTSLPMVSFATEVSEIDEQKNEYILKFKEGASFDAYEVVASKNAWALAAKGETWTYDAAIDPLSYHS